MSASNSEETPAIDAPQDSVVKTSGGEMAQDAQEMVGEAELEAQDAQQQLDEEREEEKDKKEEGEKEGEKKAPAEEALRGKKRSWASEVEEKGEESEEKKEDAASGPKKAKGKFIL